MTGDGILQLLHLGGLEGTLVAQAHDEHGTAYVVMAAYLEPQSPSLRPIPVLVCRPVKPGPFRTFELRELISLEEKGR